MRAGRGFSVELAGLAPAQADALYLRRFVTIGGVAVETARVRSQVDQSGVTESVLENPTGALQSRIPSDADADSFLESLDGARIGNRLKVTRVGNAPVIAGIRAEGTYQAPTPPLSGAVLLQINARPVVANNGPSAVVATAAFLARENIGAAAFGSLFRIQAGRVGAAISNIIADFQDGGAGVSELVSGQATLRIVPGAVALVIRDSANTTDANSFNAAGNSVVLSSSATSADLSVGSGSGTGNSNISIRRAAGLNGSLLFTSGTSLRAQVGVNNVAESGGNAGTNFRIAMYTDGGVVIDEPLTIARVANGAIVLGGAGNRVVTIAGNAWGANNASFRMNGLTTTAGAAAGTLTNAPQAGNPVDWVPININGTVRKFPCWPV